LEIVDEAVAETLHRLLGGDELGYRRVRRLKDQFGMPKDLGLVAGGDLLELGPTFHLLEPPEHSAGIRLAQHGQPDLFHLAAGIAQRMSRCLRGRDHLWIGWSEEARRG